MSTATSVTRKQHSHERGNRLLAALPEHDLQVIARDLEPIDLPVRFTLYQPHLAIEYAYFPDSGLSSSVAELQSGQSVEVGITGRDGFTGTSILLGVLSSPNRTFMQVGGKGYRVRASALQAAVERSESLRGLLYKYLHLQNVMVSQTAACNRSHEVTERLARWLLMCHDRAEDDILRLTHEFLGIMLGTRRSSVTVAAGSLQKAGLIEYTHGAVRVVNRSGLEAASCECYGIVRDEFDRVLPS